MNFVGVDGCRAGWLAVTLSLLGAWEVNLFKQISQLWERHADAALVLIDLPIGLRDGSPEPGSPERRERRCDQEARKLLVKRRSSVFRVPCRRAIYAGSYDAALALNEKLTGTRIFKATWNIAGKIREVDEFLAGQQQARETMRESHPELCFWGLNGCRSMQYAKSREKGYLERLTLLQSIYPESDSLVGHTLSQYSRKEVKKDDILDALCAAVTARVGFENLSSIPLKPEKDSRGLPMEMVYFLFSFHRTDRPSIV